MQRAFYEVEALRGNWSVRELKRQIATQYYQRTGLSTDKAAIAALAHAKAEQATPQHIIRDLRGHDLAGWLRFEHAIADLFDQTGLHPLSFVAEHAEGGG